MESGESNGKGCLKVLAIAVPLIAIAAVLFWRVSEASKNASGVAESVVAPYLDQVRAGDYEGALQRHTSQAHRKSVTAADLKAAYEELIERHGPFEGYELVMAQEHQEPGGASFVRASYALSFGDGRENVAYDVVGTGDEAEIIASYRRVSGQDLLEAEPR